MPMMIMSSSWYFWIGTSPLMTASRYGKILAFSWSLSVASSHWSVNSARLWYHQLTAFHRPYAAASSGSS